MSYGCELNNFLELARRYGPAWRGIVLCRNPGQLRVALEDFADFVKARVTHSTRTATLPGNGASMRFAVVNDEQEAERAVRRMEFTHIVWLHRPADAKVREIVRTRLRSRNVPACDCRSTYCLEEL